MNKSTILLILLLCLSPLVKVIAQDENYDAVYQSLTKEYTLNTDGTTDYRFAKTLTLQNYRSFHRLFGETFIVYNPDYQEVKVNQAFTVMADGKKVVTPDNAFNEVLPRFAAHAPAFNNLREMIITHTGLEIGSTISLDYLIRTAGGFLPAFMGSVVLAEDQPVKLMKIVIRTPKDQPLFFHLFNSSSKPSQSTENDFRVYTWTIADVPAISTEKHQLSNHGNYPVLIFSTLDSYNSLSEFFMSQESFRYQTTPEMNEFVTGLEAKYEKKTDLLFAIQESVVKDINLFHIPEEDVGYQLRTPARVWKSNGGTVAEKAVLMTTLLKQAGIQAEPVLLFPGNLFDNQIGNLATLDEWVVRAEVSGLGGIYLSVKQANAFDMRVLSGQVFMVLKEDKTVQLIYPEKKKSTLFMKGILVVDSELNLSGELNGTLSGEAIPFLALTRSDDKLKHYLRGGVASAKIKEISLSELTPNKTSFSCTLDKTDALKKDSNFYYFTVPYISTGVDGWDVSGLPAQRQTPTELPSAINESYDITIAVPENLNLVSGGQEIRIKNSAGSFFYQVKEKENMLQIRKEIDIDRNVFETGDYSALKELMDNWSLWQTNNLIFQK